MTNLCKDCKHCKVYIDSDFDDEFRCTLFDDRPCIENRGINTLCGTIGYYFEPKLKSVDAYIKEYNAIQNTLAEMDKTFYGKKRKQHVVEKITKVVDLDSVNGKSASLSEPVEENSYSTVYKVLPDCNSCIFSKPLDGGEVKYCTNSKVSTLPAFRGRVFVPVTSAVAHCDSYTAKEIKKL
jgi:hypothetical protein